MTAKRIETDVLPEDIAALIKGDIPASIAELNEGDLVSIKLHAASQNITFCADPSVGNPATIEYLNIYGCK